MTEKVLWKLWMLDHIYARQIYFTVRIAFDKSCRFPKGDCKKCRSTTFAANPSSALRASDLALVNVIGINVPQPSFLKNCSALSNSPLLNKWYLATNPSSRIRSFHNFQIRAKGYSRSCCPFIVN